MNTETFQQLVATRLPAFLKNQRSSIQVLGDTWKDDSILCFKGMLATFTIDVMWAGDGLYAAWKYAADSESAMCDLITHLQSNLQNIILDDLMSDDKWRYNLLLELGFTCEEIDPLVTWC